MWNVFAADLQNEPHAASWGFGRSVDWDRAAGRLGNHVLRGCPRWLVMVEGVGYKPGAPGEYTLGFESPPTRGGARGGAVGHRALSCTKVVTAQAHRQQTCKKRWC